MSSYIPDPVIKRLPMYYRYLSEKEKENTLFISSTELAQLMGLTASQVRQDVSAFGGEGRQGCGYPVAEMRHHIGKLLGKSKVRTLTVIGMGNLGRALVRYETFSQNSFQIISAFDTNPKKAGIRMGAVTVRLMDELEETMREAPADIAVLTLPASAAQKAAERLYACGVRGFWNYAPVDLHLPQDAAVVSVHLDESLELLGYRLEHNEG